MPYLHHAAAARQEVPSWGMMWRARQAAAEQVVPAGPHLAAMRPCMSGALVSTRFVAGLGWVAVGTWYAKQSAMGVQFGQEVRKVQLTLVCTYR